MSRRTLFHAACLVLALPLSVALPGSNFNITDGFASANGCGHECQLALRRNNRVDLGTFGQSFSFDFYDTAANFSTSQPGDVLKLQALDPTLLDTKPGTTVYRMQYTSRDLDGSPVPATGFVAFPFIPVKGSSSPYPLVAYAHGTSGIYRGCAPSNGPNLYDYDSWQLLVERGYAVVATDYAGLGNNYTLHKYLSFPAQVNDIYFSTVAARKAFSVLSDDWMAVGHSQGGGAVWKLAESDHVKNDDTYRGTVALAPAAKVIDMFLADEDEVAASGYLTLHAKALQRVTPSYNLTILGHTMRKRMAIADKAQLCLTALGGLASDLTKDEIVSQEGVDADLPLFLDWQNKMAPASGGHNPAPLLVVQGLNDTAVVPSVTRAAWERSCHDGNEVHLSEYPALDHSPVIVASAPEWLAWVDSRFAGQPTSGTCSSVRNNPLDLAHVKAPPET